MNRNMFTSTSPGAVSGNNYMDNVAEKVGALFNAMALKPTSITNSGNDYTIVIDPVLNADVVGGMGFFIKPNANNTGAVRLRVSSSNPYYNVVKSNGDALVAGDFASNTQYSVVFLDGEFRILSVAGSAADTGAHAFFQEFLVSGTWTKPVGLSANALILIEVIGGGGGGGSISGGGGGGGGAYNSKIMRASDLTASVSVTVGAGGAVNNAGGNSSFGSYVTAYGGGNGTSGGAGGGAGGGATSAGGAGNSGNGGNGGGPNFAPGLIAYSGGNTVGSSGFGVGNYGGGGGGGSNLTGGDAIYGGGGGGIGGVNGGNGGKSVYGGGGGGGSQGAGGESLFAGNGSNNNVAGLVPGGGGGRNAVGGAGKVTIRVVG